MLGTDEHGEDQLHTIEVGAMKDENQVLVLSLVTAHYLSSDGVLTNVLWRYDHQ